MSGQTELNIYESGADDASFTLDGDTVSVVADGFIGPELDIEAIKQEIAGQRFSAALDILESKQSVSSAEIELSPFWIYSIPKASRITIEVNVAEHTLQQQP